MNLDDRLVKDKRDQNRERNRRLFPDDDEDDEEYLMYAEREKQPYFNKDQGVFQHTDMKSLNSAPNVFDATALFHTKTSAENGENR